MTTSIAKLRANRQNALRSTGPRSPEGKARSSKNALRHGLTSKATLIPGEEPHEFLAFRAFLLSDLEPEGATEEVLADQVVTNAWRLRRVAQVDAGIIQAAILGEYQESVMGAVTEYGAKLSRYAGGIERSFYRALSALKGLQDRRGKRPARDVSE